LRILFLEVSTIFGSFSNQHINQSDGASSVLSSEVDSLYRPKTKETRLAYEVLLNFIQEEMGSQPHDVLRSAADEVLAVLKDDLLKDSERKKLVEELFGHSAKAPLEIARFSSLINIGKNITDFAVGGAEAQGDSAAIDDQMGVAVVFDDEGEDEEQNDSDLDEESEADEIDEQDIDRDDEMDTGMASARGETIKSAQSGAAVASAASATGELDPKSIDAHWLQREVSVYYKDALASQQIADSVFAALSEPRLDARACENRLVALLEHDKFELIRRLLKNRWKVVYCTRYARAKDDGERAELSEEMRGNSLLEPIWQALTRTGSNAQKPAAVAKAAPGKTVVAASSAASTNAVKGKSILDLEALAFAQGGHLMSNANCTMPEGTYTVDKKGYQEVHVPALKTADMGANEKLVEIASLPEWAQLGLLIYFYFHCFLCFSTFLVSKFEYC
jgi:pre-mRNA-splicing helicase BRR2